MTHEEILSYIDTKVAAILEEDRNQNDGELTAKGEAIQNGMMFLITTVSKRSKIHLSEELCLRTVFEQILFHKKLLKIDKEELKRLIPETETTRKNKDRTYNTYTYLVKKNEWEIINLIKRYQNTLSAETL